MLQEAYIDKLGHTINEDQYNKAKGKLNEEHEQLENKLGKLSTVLRQQTEIGEMVFELARYGSATYRAASDDYKRTMCNVFIESMNLHNGSLKCIIRPGFYCLLDTIKQINSSKIDILENFEKNIFEPVDFISASDNKSLEHTLCSGIRREQDSNLRQDCSC